MKKKKEKQFSPYKAKKFLKYARFIALPIELRIKEFGYHQKIDFCENEQLSERTLWRWEQQPEFWEAVEKYRRFWTKDKTPNVIAKLYNSIIEKGNAAEIKLWFQLIENWAERIKQDVSGVEIQYILPTPEQLQEIWQRYNESRNQSDG